MHIFGLSSSTPGPLQVPKAPYYKNRAATQLWTSVLRADWLRWVIHSLLVFTRSCPFHQRKIQRPGLFFSVVSRSLITIWLITVIKCVYLAIVIDQSTKSVISKKWFIWPFTVSLFISKEKELIDDISRWNLCQITSQRLSKTKPSSCSIHIE